MQAFRVGDLVRCVAPAPFGAAEEVGRVFAVLERSPAGRLRFGRGAPFCHPERFELVRAADAAATPVERAEDLVTWFAAGAAGAGGAAGPMPPVARAACLRGMRAVMEAAFGQTFRADADGHVAFGTLRQEA